MKNTILTYNKNSISITTNIHKKIIFSIDYTHKALCEKHPLLTTSQKEVLKSKITDLIFKLIEDAHSNRSIRYKIEVPSIIYKNFNYYYKHDNNKYYITYTQMLEILASPGCMFLLPRSKSYEAGEFSKFVYLNRWCTEEEISENQMLYTRTIRSKSPKIDGKILLKHPNLIKNLDAIKIDINGYLKFLINNKVNKYKVRNKNVVLKHQTNLSKVNKLNLVINYILKNYYATDGKIKTGRLYTSFTGLPSDLMPYITYRGKKLIERDAANFGPAVIGMLTGNKYLIEAASQGKFYDNIGEAIYLDYHKRIKVGTPDEKNTTFYNNIVKLSQQYLKKTGNPLIVDREFTRNFAKLQSFGSLLYVNTPHKTGRFADIINEVYPGLIEDLEKLQKETNSKFDTLAAEVQSIEADIFVKPFLKIKKFYLTKHDSIFFNEEDIEYFDNKLKENLEKAEVITKLK